MKSLAAGTLTALAQPSVPIVQLVHMAFSSPVALNTSTMDLVYGGVTYKGAYGLGSIGAVKDSPGEIKGLQFTCRACRPRPSAWRWTAATCGRAAWSPSAPPSWMPTTP
jgi:hypothetical protein